MANESFSAFRNKIKADLPKVAVDLNSSNLQNRNSPPIGLVIGTNGRKLNSWPANPETSVKYTDKNGKLKDILVGLATGALIAMVALYARS